MEIFHVAPQIGNEMRSGTSLQLALLLVTQRMMSQGAAGRRAEESAAPTVQFVTDDWVDGLNLINI